MSGAYRLLLSILWIMALVGCSSFSVQKEDAPHDDGLFSGESVRGRVLFMECTGGYEYPAHVQMNQAWLFLPEGPVRLEPQKAESGSRFSNDDYTFWLKEESGTLEAKEESPRHCQNNRARAVWAEAKLRGADYRAVGNEPGWYLELSLGGNLVYVGDYGTTRLLFKTPDPDVDQSRRTSTYKMNDGEHAMSVRIEGKECRDSMSGEVFDTTVTIYLDGKTLQGCGRALH
ncbi:MliC family protein [Endozoicomonas sp. Mp262]|uniref:MliC family protein n=1 Tax=Endozoicomonas sp. Mp262 TaxID=2919499 RepID=UPI0021D8C91B